MMIEGGTSQLALVRLQSWLSPAFPVGAYSYSHGLEFAVEAGYVKNAPTLLDWLESDLSYGIGYNDGLFFAAAHRSVSARNLDAFAETAELAAALRGSSELAFESQAQGRAFLSTVWRAWPHAQAKRFTAALRERETAPTYPIAMALACALHGTPLNTSLPLFLQANVANLINAGVRLIPLGQTDGQKAAGQLQPAILRVAHETEEGDLDKVGSATMMIDWTSMQHESQYTRLFRS